MTGTKNRRAVRILSIRGNWFVEYANRKKQQRYFAAQFYGPDHSYDEIKAWVMANDKLELIEDVDHSGGHEA
jgi:hypothetical protein